ncbi:MAG: hypothetical protein AAF551_05120 [Bacteroidota bacterium]
MMKSRKFIIATIGIVLAAALWSCEDSEEVDPQTSQPSTSITNALIGANSPINRLKGQGFAGPVGAVYGNFFNGSRGRSAGSPSAALQLSRGRNATDTVQSCLNETWKEDGNGNYTYTLDFGDGCQYYGEFLKGKLVEKGSYTDNTFSSVSTYTNFGGKDWQIDGTYSSNGNWEEGINGSFDEDSMNFKATYQFEANLTEQWVDDENEVNEDTTNLTTLQASYQASGSEKMDNAGFTIESQTESITLNTGESYTSKVETPLHFDFGCEEDEVWVFVKGVESGTYTYDGTSGTYRIDFGDGTCDNLVTITENGVSEQVDLGDEWDEDDEDDEEDEDDNDD